MPIRSHDAIPSFIQLEEQHQLLSTRPDSAIVAPSVQQRSQPKRVHQANRVSSSASKNNMDKLSPPIEQTTTMFMRRLNISHNPHHHPHAISKRGGHRSATLRVRGKHGAVKSPHMYSSVHCRHSVDIHSSDPLRKFNYSGPFNQESRLVLLKKYMQSRRIHLRQRLTRQHLQQHDSLDTSDMSLDEADLMEEDDDVRDQQSDLNSGLATDQEQYRRYMWTLEQRLRERIRSAERSRSHFLMERRLSAGERVDHAYRVVQRQRTEQEDRQHRARDKLEQKMMRAMARRNAYLEAAIENDPSRRFRRKSSGTTINSTAPITSINKVTTHLDKASTPEVKRPSSDLEVAAPIAVTKVPNMKIFPTVIRPNSSFVGKSTTGRKNEAHKHGSTKNSLTDMTQVTDEKHLTSMTTRKCILPTLTTMTKISPLSGSLQQKHHNSTADNDVEASAVAGVHRDMKITATSEMQRHSYERLIQRASRDYIKAIGSHQYIFTLGFDELARLLHTSKPLIHATLRLLKYSSQLVQLTQDNGTDHNQTFEKYKNPARVFLSMYMVLAHPSQIRSPTEVMTVSCFS
ncbi:hypothetical protein BX616_010688 [Lobosporangium transversale]|uniref:Uncharacterized protein n=1 Tax=Lobosporangium transversale TaxID=64571 RepID=A0A1Y2G650_9FUNG|nr:hypothetical protein BCR41DRAFT_402072 [Lobosporangium transversale]KAF9917991.1 hypothetical protein BX616_010688 [Lobosporangium transversale]ORY97042.1 hypothetical protein BCR41DRAFT_402072 [Lobosporangium transversale]|eukprot:XP_021875588.1 hypothetical protein BCR41DRAFT_402072 [Lobosporangium transversale]